MCEAGRAGDTGTGREREGWSKGGGVTGRWMKRAREGNGKRQREKM